MEKDCVQHVLRRFHELEKERRTWEEQWKEIAQLMLPNKGKWSADSHNKGYKKHGQIVDSTALYALRILSAGMHGGLSSPARPWFRFSLKDKELEQAEGIGKWLQDTQERVHAVLSGSNFYPTVHAHYAELAGFGTACFLIDDGALAKILNETGFGSHPEVVRFMYRVGKALAEKDLPKAKESIEEKSAAELFYPSMVKG